MIVLQLIDDSFDIRQKVETLLQEKSFDSKRARNMDQDDFLG